MNIPVSGGQKVKGDEIEQESFCKGFLITLDWKWRPLTQFIIIIIPLNFCKPYDHNAEYEIELHIIIIINYTVQEAGKGESSERRRNMETHNKTLRKRSEING